MTIVPAVEPSKAKTWVSLIGSFLTFLIPAVLYVQDTLPQPWPIVIGAVLAGLTASGVYNVPYKPANTTIVKNEDIPAINAGTALVPEPAPEPEVIEAPRHSDSYRNPWK